MPMKTLVQKIRDELMSTEDTVCLQRARLVTEAYQQYEDDPVARPERYDQDGCS